MNIVTVNSKEELREKLRIKNRNYYIVCDFTSARLNLSDNEINSLAGVIFHNSLERLYLSYNEIDSLARVTFSNSLVYLDLRKNKTTC